MSSYDVIVVGGGIIGSAIVYELAKRNKQVLVLERNRLAGEASGAAAGMLAAQVEMGREVGPLFSLAVESRSLFPELASELRELSGIDIGLVNEGMLKVPKTGAEAAGFGEIIQIQAGLGQEVGWCSDVSRKEPAVSRDIERAMEVAADGQVDAPALSLAFARSAQAFGAEVREFAQVQSLVVEGGRVVGVRTLNETIYSKQVVIAAGAWSEALLAGTGAGLQTYPVKGECFSVVADRPLLKSTLFSHGCYLVPKKGNRLLIGATATPGSFEKTVSIEGLQSLLTAACHLLPALKKCQWEKAWAGTRPQTADGLPYLGLHPAYPNVAVATGHYRNGILLSAVTGRVIADLLEGKVRDGLAPFRVGRQGKDEEDGVSDQRRVS